MEKTSHSRLQMFSKLRTLHTIIEDSEKPAFSIRSDPLVPKIAKLVLPTLNTPKRHVSPLKSPNSSPFTPKIAHFTPKFPAKSYEYNFTILKYKVENPKRIHTRSITPA